MSIGGLPALKDGYNARAELYDRLIERLRRPDVPVVRHQRAGLNSVGDPSVATKVVSVGSYISADTWLSNYGSGLRQRREHAPVQLARSPRRRRLQAGAHRTQRGHLDHAPVAGCGPVAGTYALPPGYSMLNGTSMSAPRRPARPRCSSAPPRPTSVQAPARPSSVSPYVLVRALLDTNRFQRIRAGQRADPRQGAATCAHLLKPRRHQRPPVPVDTALSGFLATPGVGTGIYDREGVNVGESYTRTYTFVRTSDGRSPHLQRDAGWATTARSPRRIVGDAHATSRPVEFPVTSGPRSVGIHSAILQPR